MIELSIHSTRVGFDFSFFAVMALMFFLDSGGLSAGIAACVIHEMGHLVVMGSTGVSVERILFYGAGIRISADLSDSRFGQRLAVLSAGCTANLLSAFVFVALGWNLGVASSIATALFNLLCLGELDGAAIIRLFCERYLSPTAEKRVLLIMRLISGVLCAAMVFMLNGDVSLTLLITLVYIMFLMAFDW